MPLLEPKKVTPGRALQCCAARVLCSLHRLCLVPFLALSQYDRTAFHFAATFGGCSTAVVLALLAAGADRTAKNKVSAMNNKGQC